VSGRDRELESQIEGFAAGLQALGLQPGDRVRTVHASRHGVAQPNYICVALH
jgi:non-ribosomal peptide synthetase component E (peptide arylation enzyme)